MKRILKFQLGAPVPEDHKFLHAGIQHGEYFVWAETAQPTVMSNNPYRMVPTGVVGAVPEGSTYKGTIIDDARGLVWHIYDVRGTGQ